MQRVNAVQLLLFQVNAELEVPPTRVLQLEMNPPR